jgi:hypothetical protein
MYTCQIPLPCEKFFLKPIYFVLSITIAFFMYTWNLLLTVRKQN